MRSVLALSPTTQFGLLDPVSQVADVFAVARVLMGSATPIQLISGAIEVPSSDHDWRKPPRIRREWLAVTNDDDPGTPARLARALEGVGLRCGPVVDSSDPVLGGDTCWRTDRDYCRQGDTLAASLVLARWPREVMAGWLGNALAGEVPVDLAIHVQPKDAESVARDLRTQQLRQAGSDDAGDQLGAQDAETLRRKVVARVDAPVRAAIVMTVRAPTRELLKQRVATIKHECKLTLAELRDATFEQDRGLEATQPTGRCNLIGAYQTTDCTAVALTWPFQPATVFHKNGADLGTTHEGGMLVRLDPFDPSLESFGGIVLAKVGAGKSYLLKKLARNLPNVEVLIVEQRNPPEYTGVKGATTLHLDDATEAERKTRLRDFVSSLWKTAKRDPRPRLLILDELWSLLRDPALAALVEEVARIGRHHYLSLWIASQQVQELVSSDQGLAVLNNAAIKVYLKQNGPDGELLANKVGLSTPARQFLRTAARGQALLDVNGMLVPVDVQASQSEHREITTDPREKVAA